MLASSRPTNGRPVNYFLQNGRLRNRQAGDHRNRERSLVTPAPSFSGPEIILATACSVEAEQSTRRLEFPQVVGDAGIIRRFERNKITLTKTALGLWKAAGKTAFPFGLSVCGEGSATVRPGWRSKSRWPLLRAESIDRSLPPNDPHSALAKVWSDFMRIAVTPITSGLRFARIRNLIIPEGLRHRRAQRPLGARRRVPNADWALVRRLEFGFRGDGCFCSVARTRRIHGQARQYLFRLRLEKVAELEPKVSGVG